MEMSTYVFESNYMEEEMKKINSEIHDDHFNEKIQELYHKKINITGNSNLQYVIGQIDEYYSVGSYEKFFLDYIHNTLPNGETTPRNYLLECYIIEKLMEVGKLASINGYKNNSPILKEIVETVTNFGPYHLIQMFHDSEKEYEMIKLFVDYEFRNTNLKGEDLLESLEDTKRNIERYYATEIYKSEIHQKRDYLLNQLKCFLENKPVWDTLKFINFLEYRAIIAELKEFNKLGIDDVVVPFESVKNLLNVLKENRMYYANQLTKKR